MHLKLLLAAGCCAAASATLAAEATVTRSEEHTSELQSH